MRRALAGVGATLVAYRCGLLLLPRFADELAAAPAAALALGLASDLAVFLGFAALLRLTPARWRTVVILFAALALAMHLRLVEYFGWSLRPEHLALLQTPTSWRGGLAFLFDSRAAFAMLAAAWLMTAALIVMARGRPLAWTRRVYSRRAVPLWLVSAVTLQIGSQELSMQRGISLELTRQAFVQIATTFVEHALDNPELEVPSLDELSEVRRAFSSERPWADVSPAFPLWQRSVWQGVAGSDANEATRQELRHWLAAEARDKGPWNIVVVQQESLRAHELEVFATDQAGTSAYAGMTPGLSRILRDGVRFTNVLATGNMTHFGELASACSLYATPFHNVLLDAPTTQLTCLPDAFAALGYHTVFAVGTDPHVNARSQFYPLHRTAAVWTEPTFAADLPRQGWGVTDAAFFSAMLERFGTHEAPFYAHLLTLSNHAPFDVPRDLPSDLARHGDRKAVMLSYLDRTFTRFYDQLVARHPHTIVVFTADHGEWPPGGFPEDDVSTATMTKLHRIPLAIVVPGLPAALQGRVVDRLGSDADLAPTLLNLLGMTSIPNAFMGEDLFRRREPIVVKWGESWRTLRAGSSGFTVSEPWARSRRLVYGALGKFGLFMPRASFAQGGRQ